jgi:hypothetical protein
MNNDGISLRNSSAEQHPYVDNQQDENTAQNEIPLKRIVNVINKVKHSPRIPTPLYKTFFSII